MTSPAARKPEGGFHFIAVRQLCAVWCTYQIARIRLIDVRVWFAAQELVARRCQLRPKRQPIYTYEELARVVGRGGNLSASLDRLQASGLLTWDPHAITFNSSLPEQVTSVLETMLARITNHRRRVPVPRRLLRFLATGCSRVPLATVLGHLFRCLYYRNKQCYPEGLCKASWIAEVFGVSERAVKTARRRLEAIGFFQRSETPQWLLNRYGQRMAINLRWSGPPLPKSLHSERAIALAPLQTVMPPELAPLDSHRELPSEENNQEPAAGRPTGLLSFLFTQARANLRAGTAVPFAPEPDVAHVASTPKREEPRSPPRVIQSTMPTPQLQHMTVADLTDTDRLLGLYAQSVRAKLIGSSEAERLTFVGLAQHVLSYHPANAGGLFRQLLVRRCFHYVTQEEEDVAQRRLKQYLFAGRGSPLLQTLDANNWSGSQTIAA